MRKIYKSDYELKENDELKVIDQIIGGDKKAFIKILEIYEKKIFGFINSIINDPYISQDLAQETFIKVYKNIHTYDRTREFSTWIYSIARNETFNYLRKIKKMRYVEINDDIDLNKNNRAKKHMSIEEQYETKEEYLEICEIIDNLPEKYRDLIILKYFRDLSYKEISLRLNLTEKKVESWLYLARKKIVKQFKKNNCSDRVMELRSATK